MSADIPNDPELSILHRRYDQMQAFNHERDRKLRRRSGTTRSLGDIMLSPSVLADIAAIAYKPLTSDQLAINAKGYAELAEVVAKLEAKRR